MNNKKMALQWLESAFYDILVIEEILYNEQLTHIAAFHAQQAVEKSCKAILEYNGKPVPKKHDLLQLKHFIPELVINDEDILDSLNRLYIEGRYPGDFGLLPDGKPTLSDAKEFYSFAKNIYGKVKALLENGSNDSE